MRQARRLQLTAAFALSLSMGALVLDLSVLDALRVNVDDSMTVDDSFVPDSDGTRHLYAPVEMLSATPPGDLLALTWPLLVTFHVILPVDSPRAVLVLRATAPRAPPAVA